jgi:hypothetical protein
MQVSCLRIEKMYNNCKRLSGKVLYQVGDTDRARRANSFCSISNQPVLFESA